jgi:hypothetical protein
MSSFIIGANGADRQTCGRVSDFLNSGGRVPILVRPVREQLEHDRVIRHLQAKLKRKYDVTVNIGEEKNASVKSGQLLIYPDLVLNSLEKGRRLSGVIEVETGESVNHLEAMAQWTHLGRTRVPFYLYVPAGAVEIARRLCADNAVSVSEMWSYHAIGDQIRFTLVQRAPAPAARARPAAPSRPKSSAARPAKRAAVTRKPVKKKR